MKYYNEIHLNNKKFIFVVYNLKQDTEASKMAEQVKALATRPDKLASVPRTYVVEGQNQLPQVVL